MSGKFATLTAPLRRFRIDPSDEDGPRTPSAGTLAIRSAWPVAALAALGGLLVLWGGGSLDLGPVEARVGLAAGESIGPFGQVLGGWEPGLWPAQVLPSQVWAWLEGGEPSPGAVRWPSALAGVALGLILARRLGKLLGPIASVMVGLCWFGSLALIDRSGGAGLDLVAGLGLVAALDRIVGEGSDWVAGAWASLAFLAGGWPPLAVLALATVVIGRPGASLTARLAIPPLVAAAAWSAWALASAPAEAWGAALALPLTRSSAWLLPFGVIGLSLPWGPFAILTISRTVRASWPEPARVVVVGWLQVAGACLLAGAAIPGLADAARLPALAGLAIASAAVLERAWAGSLDRGPRRFTIGLTLTLGLAWAAISVIGAGYLAVAISYYRPVAIVLILAGLAIGLAALDGAWLGDPRRSIAALVAIAICLKIAHWGVYVPEWNYRRSQGPWGRAIAQHVPPRWPIYTQHAWNPDLAFAIGHPIRQLGHPRLLEPGPGGRPSFVLLHPEEFKHWPAEALPLVKVREFQDEIGRGRVLARTEGSLLDLIRAGRDD